MLFWAGKREGGSIFFCRWIEGGLGFWESFCKGLILFCGGENRRDSIIFSSSGGKWDRDSSRIIGRGLDSLLQWERKA